VISWKQQPRHKPLLFRASSVSETNMSSGRDAASRQRDLTPREQIASDPACHHLVIMARDLARALSLGFNFV
jgi:hypothetical protein